MTKTKILRTDCPAKDISIAALEISQGAIAVAPTDTVYGIITNCFAQKSVKKIYRIKKRPYSKALPVFICSVAQAKKLAKWPKQAQALAKKHWPGALTLVLAAQGRGLKIAAKDNTIALRMPDNKFLLKLMRMAKVPLASTSANISGEPPVKAEKEAVKKFSGKANYIFLGGSLTGKESTIIDLSVKPAKILRPGVLYRTVSLVYTR
ncbi:MAG: L-threonylcarbamoyladenylate synthase [Elusimicrobia bacterium]|nr:L-threonylcarbamoyladenylate synthase [Elusimicrobiota bacterium]